MAGNGREESGQATYANLPGGGGGGGNNSSLKVASGGGDRNSVYDLPADALLQASHVRLSSSTILICTHMVTILINTRTTLVSCSF